MFCPTCGKKQPENANYCFSCGRKIDIPIQDDDSLPENMEFSSTDKTCIEKIKNEVQVVSEELPVLQLNGVENKEERIGEDVKCPHCGLWQRRDRVICFRCEKSLDGAPLLDKKIEKLDDKTGIDKSSTRKNPTSVGNNRNNNTETDIDSTNAKEEHNDLGNVSMSETNEETANVETTCGEWISCPFCGLWQMKDRTTCYRCGKAIGIKKQDKNVEQISEKQGKEERMDKTSSKQISKSVDMIDDSKKNRGIGVKVLLIILIGIVIFGIADLINQRDKLMRSSTKYNDGKFEDGEHSTERKSSFSDAKDVGKTESPNKSQSPTQERNSYSKLSYMCEATGCDKEGIYSIKGITGKTEYYCKKHYDEMQSLVNNMIESSSGSFTNEYGTSTTKCAHAGCNNYIASSGDTSYCVKHSRHCLACGKYIDEDAMYCMDCILKAYIENNVN